MSDITEEVTDKVLPDAVTDTADSVAEPEHEPEPEHHDPDWKAPVSALENRVSELTEAIAGLTARVPAPELVTPDDGPSHDSTPTKPPWTHRGFKRRNVVE